MVSGEFEGECRANLIQILANGKFTGSLFSDQLVIEPGGNFFGDSHSQSEKKAGLELVHNEKRTDGGKKEKEVKDVAGQ